VFGRGRQHAQAVIVARETHEGMYRHGVNFYAPTGLYHHVYDYVADVTPGGSETPFRAMFTEMFESDEEYRPTPGDTVAVTFDKDHKLAFDRNALHDRGQAVKKAERSNLTALASQPVGTPPPNAPVDRLTVDPRVGILQVSLRQAERRGDTAEVSRLSAQLAELEGGLNPGA
jgi:hypothetical protein